MHYRVYDTITSCLELFNVHVFPLQLYKLMYLNVTESLKLIFIVFIFNYFISV